MIRTLDPTTDRALVDAFFQTSADYIRMERGEPPGPEVTDEYFTDAPPGCDPAKSLRQGQFCGPDLIALAEMAFGFPTPAAAYLGLMIVAPAARGTGAGLTLLRHVEQAARNQACTHIYLSVLDANPRGHAFWTRHGFAHTGKSGPVTLGRKSQTAHRLFKPL